VTGDQGTGKTCLVTTVPEGWKVFVSDIDGGLEPARNIWLKQGRDIDHLVWRQAESFRGFHAAVWNPPSGFNLYVLDTYTIGMIRIKKHVMAAMGIGPEELVDWMKIGGKISSMAVDYFENWREKVAAQGAWGLVLCQEKLEGDDNPKVVPDLVGQARRHVAGICSELFHLEKEAQVVAGKKTWRRVFRTKELPGVMAKDRSLALDEIEPADLKVVIDKITLARKTKEKECA
jgi:hypothetical protein